jgi:hypothetical protein
MPPFCSSRAQRPSIGWEDLLEGPDFFDGCKPSLCALPAHARRRTLAREMRDSAVIQKVCAMANSKDEQVSVRLSAEQRAKLEKLAEQDDRTLSSTIRRIVTRALSQSEGLAA